MRWPWWWRCAASARHNRRLDGGRLAVSRGFWNASWRIGRCDLGELGQQRGREAVFWRGERRWLGLNRRRWHGRGRGSQQHGGEGQHASQQDEQAYDGDRPGGCIAGGERDGADAECECQRADAEGREEGGATPEGRAGAREAEGSPTGLEQEED